MKVTLLKEDKKYISIVDAQIVRQIINAKKLHKTVDRILCRFGGLSGKDTDDFYSLANEVFADIIGRYDFEQSFDGFLCSCLSNKIMMEITRRNREKRNPNMIGELIYSVLKNNYILPIILGEETTNGISKMWIIDGLQRSSSLSLFRYANTKITKSLDESCTPRFFRSFNIPSQNLLVSLAPAVMLRISL